MMPIVLPPNVLPHFYRGGTRLAALRGFVPQSAFGPEDWLAATVHRAGTAEIGPSRLTDGRLFADLVAADPAGWLGTPDGGPDGPSDTGILVKLLDADQRLPVHVHPDRAFAARHLHSCYGKTEAWYVLAADGENPSFWVGFADDVDPLELAKATEAQDSGWLLSRMNRIPAVPGEAVLVPAGTAHAISAGVFVVEVQEPSDLSILLEWSITTSTREESHLELGFDIALTGVSHRRLGPEQLDLLVRRTDPGRTADSVTAVLPPAANEYFRVNLLTPPAGGTVAVGAGYSVVIVVDGAGTISGSGQLPVTRGQVLAVPAGFGPWTAAGDVRLVQCVPGPAPLPSIDRDGAAQ